MALRAFFLGITLPLAIPCASAMPITSQVASDAPASLPSPADIADTISLQEVTIATTFRKAENSPLRLTTIGHEAVQAAVTKRTYPEIMQGIPGLYATAETGSYGDAKLNIRGFKQENIAVLLNGIPIQGLTSGSMYWNNWMGLQDATYALQVQKGIGGSMLSDCAMGGSVNIQTINSDLDPHTEFALSQGQYGLTKGSLTYQSGELPHGWNVALSLSYTQGGGYVKQTDVETFSYMLSIGKHLNEQHTLLFTALGSPEEHDQRNTKLTNAEVQQYGTDYNKNWGYLRGNAYSLSRNHYHKPYFTLQHFMHSDRLSMRNSVYLALASGGGRWNETQSKAIAKYTRATDGLIDFEQVMADNLSWSGVDAHPEQGKAAQNIITDYLSGHTQLGVISSADYQLTEAWTLGAGLQYQYFRTYEREEVVDLLGADYWYENYAGRALCGQNGRDSYKHVGDRIRRDNGREAHVSSLYVEAQYHADRLNATLGASLFQGNYQRRDFYNYTAGNQYSDWAHGTGFSLKGGLLFNLTDNHHTQAYFNLGYNSRLPYGNIYFSSGTLEITKDVKNETNLQGEIGLRHRWTGGSLEAGFYLAKWGNKTLQSAAYRQTDADAVKYQITGLDALHYGLELSAEQQVFSWLSAKAYASFGHWEWQNNVTATIYDTQTDLALGTVNVYADGLPVGDAPQTQLGALLSAKWPGGFFATADWQMNGRMYADFEPSSRTNADDHVNPYRIPTYHLLGGSLGWNGQLNRQVGLTLFVTGQNLTNTCYIERATDGTTHDLSSLTGYWGCARTVSCGLRLRF